MTHRFDLAVHYFLRHEYENAATAFREVVKERPGDGRAWAYLGIALAHLGQASEAEGALSRAIALSPENAEAWFHLGVARSLRDEWLSAAQAYQRTVALTPGDMVAWHRLGVALAEAGDEPAASAAFERALVLSREAQVPAAAEVPEPPVAPPPLETAPPPRPAVDDHLEETGEREGAREAKSWLDLALSLLALGDQDEAIAAYERAYTLDPERARRSLFRPMLRLITAVQDGSEAPGPDDPRQPPESPRRRPPRPEIL